MRYDSNDPEVRDEISDYLEYRTYKNNAIDRALRPIPTTPRTPEQLTKSAARRRARLIGLKYWPALLEEQFGDVDPRAYLVAERILARKTNGVFWGEKDAYGNMSHGGWDSCGHYGMSPYQVRMAWYAAGCKDGAKFRLQISRGYFLKSGDSLPWCKNYFRGQRLSCKRSSLLRLLMIQMPRLAALVRARRDPLHRPLVRQAIRLLVTSRRRRSTMAIPVAARQQQGIDPYLVE